MIIQDLQIEPTLDGAKISFLTKDITAVNNLVGVMGKKPLEANIQPRKSTRSNNANAYMWVLCDKIAQKVNSTKEEIYRMAVREVGVFQDVAVQKQALPQLVEIWTARGVGWLVDTFDSKLEGCARVRLYTGSHLYDTGQMARLIEFIISEAKGLGIETMTPDEISEMLGVKNGASL